MGVRTLLGGAHTVYRSCIGALQRVCKVVWHLRFLQRLHMVLSRLGCCAKLTIHFLEGAAVCRSDLDFRVV